MAGFYETDPSGKRVWNPNWENVYQDAQFGPEQELQNQVFRAVGYALEQNAQTGNLDNFWADVMMQVAPHIAPPQQIDRAKLQRLVNQALAYYQQEHQPARDEYGLQYTNDPDQPRLEHDQLPWTPLTEQQQQAIPEWGQFPSGVAQPYKYPARRRWTNVWVDDEDHESAFRRIWNSR